jgi:D-cysteine desulfhydrase
MITPLLKISELSNELQCDIFIKRDDLYPITFGGNKARKISNIIKDMKSQNINAVVTTGGTQSNHARVVAMTAAQNNWPCHLVLHGCASELNNPCGNLLISKLSNAVIDIVTPDKINKHMKSAMNKLQQQGYNPYEIPGGGHCVAGTIAYVDAVKEVAKQCENMNIIPDYIILASGTGTTQAGIMAGVDSIGWNTKVIGVSVARCNPQGGEIIQQAYNEVRQQLQIVSGVKEVNFRDEWTCGGYEKVDERLCDFIEKMAKNDNILLDPTYTGKAFLALVDMITSREIQPGSTILFWHTGGLMNLMSSPHFTKNQSNEMVSEY